MKKKVFAITRGNRNFFTTTLAMLGFLFIVAGCGQDDDKITTPDSDLQEDGILYNVSGVATEPGGGGNG